MILSVLVATSAAVAQQPMPAVSLTFGVYSFKRPTDVLRDFDPAVRALGSAMTTKLGKPVTIDVKVYRTYEECLERFLAGDVDFVRFGPASYVLAHQRNPAVSLLAAEQEDGQKRCKGVIAVRADSPIRSVADTRGRSFAFGDENSTIGRYLAQAVLIDAGIKQEDLSGSAFLERHDRVFKAVAAGDYDAGAMHIATFLDMNKNHELREVARFDNVGKPWVARAGLAKELIVALRESLLAMTDEKALAALKVHGFQTTADSDFQLVRDGMKKAERFAPPPATPGNR
ncbi:MAG: PhnD/SsuA/transferrin family substrate-binding protein [Planctomycetes bacterium]|nr:PhnD/SsuA/transferrin family substrate-binding protein [Planctomycetota bacterium]